MPFRNSRIDFFVTTVAFIVFIYAFFFASFHPMLDADGDIIYTKKSNGIPVYSKVNDGTYHTIQEINLQIFIAPIVLIYEMFVLIVLPGKPKLRELPWKIYRLQLKFIILDKLDEGLQELREWRSHK